MGNPPTLVQNRAAMAESGSDDRAQEIAALFSLDYKSLHRIAYCIVDTRCHRHTDDRAPGSSQAPATRIDPCMSGFRLPTEREDRWASVPAAFCKKGNTQTILLFSFASEDDRRLWIRRGRRTQFSLPGRTVIVTGDTWEMHFTDSALARKVATELKGRIVDQ